MTIKISQLANLTVTQANTIVPVVSNITGTLTTVKANVEQLQTYILGTIPADVITLQTNAATQSDLIISINANVSRSNIGMKGYVDNSTLTANIGMKGYVDAQTYSNVQVATYLRVGNPSNISVAGNVTSTYFLGNGALLTGIVVAGSSTNYSNINAVAYLGTGVSSDILPTTSNTYSLGSSTKWWTTTYSQAVNAAYADLAENYSADADYLPGTVVDFGGSAEITLSSQDLSVNVAGVVSTRPGYLMNTELLDTHVVSVALQGRVPTRVTGKISKGNMLVSAGNGHARAELSPSIGTVIGKALENFDGDEGVIEIVVGIR